MIFGLTYSHKSAHKYRNRLQQFQCNFKQLRPISRQFPFALSRMKIFWFGLTLKVAFTHVNPQIWRLAWGSKSAPKIYNYIWKAIVGTLPTSANLHKRKIGVSHLWKICGLFPESIEHCLLLCDWTELVRFGSSIRYSQNKQGVSHLLKIGCWRLITRVRR